MDPTTAAAAQQVAQTAAERFWTLMGTVGDTIGGFANLATFIVVVISVRYARREVTRNREQHAAEVLAAVARQVWVNAHGTLTAVWELRRGAMRNKSAQLIDKLTADLFESIGPLRASVADVKLHFGESGDLFKLMERLADLADIARGRAKMEMPMEDEKKLDADLRSVSDDLIKVLRPVALLQNVT